MADLFRRGAFSVWGKRSPKQEKESRLLYKEAHRLHERSVLGETEVFDRAVWLANDLDEAYGSELPLPALISLSSALEELILEAGLYPPRIALEKINHEGPQGRALRSTLRDGLNIYRNFNAHFPLVLEALDGMASHILGRLALNPGYKAALGDVEELQDGPSLRLIDHIEDIGGAIAGILRVSFSHELREGRLFKDLQDTLDRNAKIASGLELHKNYPLNRYVLPDEASYSDPAELARRYLGDMPLVDMLQTPLPARLPLQSRFEHTHVLAGSGHGKTQLLSQLIHQDILEGRDERRSIVVFDSQGDLIEKIIALQDVAEGSWAQKTVILDPTDFYRPIALNPFSISKDRLESYDLAERERVIHSAVDLFEHFFGALLGADLTAQQGTTFKFLIRLLVEIPNATLLTLRDLMDRPEDFKRYWQGMSGSARMFFEREFLSNAYRPTRKQISRRLWAVLSNPVFERLFSSPENKLDWFELMQSGSLILVNTAKDFLKTDGSSLLGKFFMAQIAQGTLERASMPERERTPTFVYLDEAQDYIDETTELLLTQGRKYRLGLTLAHQHLDQLTTSERGSILANTSIKLAGGINRKDAQLLSGEIRSDADYLQSMRKRANETQFALSIRHQTDKAIPLNVPLGAIDRKPKASTEAVSLLKEFSRTRYGRDYTPEVYQAASADQPKHEVEVETHANPEGSLPVREAKEEPEFKPTRIQTSPLLPEKPAGQGSKDHIYLQNLIKGLAEERGFRADIEASVEGGSIDLLLKRGQQLIAVEIGLTTPPEHEIGHVEKCLAAGAKEVWLVGKTKKRLQALQKSAKALLSPEIIQKVSYHLPEDLALALKKASEAPLSENTIRGYRVKVTTGDLSAVNERRAKIAKVIAKSISKGDV